jgi:hypothetical protein
MDLVFGISSAAWLSSIASLFFVAESSPSAYIQGLINLSAVLRLFLDVIFIPPIRFVISHTLPLPTSQFLGYEVAFVRLTLGVNIAHVKTP